MTFTGCLEFAKQHLRVSKHYVRQTRGTANYQVNIISMVKLGDGSIMLWECISSSGSGKLVRIEAKMNAAKYTEITEENLLLST